MKLIRANVNDCEKIWKMQTEAFSDLLERYQDCETSPGNEAKERIEAKLSQEFTYFYYIFDGDSLVGAIRVVDKKDGSRKRVAPVFIMKEFRNKGLAQKAFEEVEKIHGHDNWKLDTILQEEGYCLLRKELNNFQFSNEGRCAECPKNASGIPMNMPVQLSKLVPYHS